VSATNYAVPVITASGTVVASIGAAILTGFRAAKVKHKRDVEDNDIRWGRERFERRRDELKSAFVRYLAARGRTERALVNVGARRTWEDIQVAGDAFSDFQLAFAELEILLREKVLLRFRVENQPFLNWLSEAYKQATEAGVALDSAPSPQGVIDLAKVLLDD
jgi:hypothetical protein